MDDKDDETVKDYSESSVRTSTRKITVKDVEENTCSLILLATTSFVVSEILNFTLEKLRRESQDLCEQPVKRGNTISMQTRLPQTGLLILQFFDMIGHMTYQPRIPPVTRNFEIEEFSLCDCHDIFNILEDILRSGNFKFSIFRNCRGKADFSIGTTTKPITLDEFRILDSVLADIRSSKDDIDDLIYKTFTLDEVAKKSAGLLKSDQNFLKELNEFKNQHRINVGKVRELKEKFCGEIAKSDWKIRHTDGNTSNNILPLHQQIQNLTLNANPILSDPQASRSHEPVTVTVLGTNANTADDIILPRKFSNVPQRSQLSRRKPVQESSGNNTARTRAETGAILEDTTSHFNSRDVGQAIGGNTSAREQNSGGESTGVKQPMFSCDHYERHCNVQFSCCKKFWPCHRCHNSDTSCEIKTLRSRDIKNVKCKQCGKVQEFPKETAHCVECNLKFAEYFCAVCQHLTGTQSQLYHCEKCGICRLHGNSSFHCDVCGVCFHVNLRDNHKCRGSANDECCICFKDAFTGYQMLPCSHKVHTDCASLMLRNGMTKCPLCRASFESSKVRKRRHTFINNAL